MNIILNKIKKLQTKFNQHKITNQSLITQLYQLQNICMKYHMNMINYLYRNGIFNKATAIADIQNNINRTSKFPNQCKVYQNEVKVVNKSSQKWFENYGIHDGAHDLIKVTLDNWKIRALLNSLISDLYIGSYNEDTSNTLMRGTK